MSASGCKGCNCVALTVREGNSLASVSRKWPNEGYTRISRPWTEWPEEKEEYKKSISLLLYVADVPQGSDGVAGVPIKFFFAASIFTLEPDPDKTL